MLRPLRIDSRRLHLQHLLIEKYQRIQRLVLRHRHDTPSLNPARTTQPITVRLDTAGRLVMTVNKPSSLDLSMLRYTVEFSTDLTTWSTAQSSILQNTASMLEVRDHLATTTSAKRYVRLTVTPAP